MHARPRIHTCIITLRAYICRSVDDGSDSKQVAIIDQEASHGRHLSSSPEMMDTLFVLGQESRLRILEQAAARVPGCAYLCVWAPIPGQPSSSSSAAAATSALLLCLDAWLCDGSRGDDRVRALFDAYRGSFCAVVSGCVPGWAYKDGRAYMELPEHDLAASASLPVQQQFYQEAGIKMAAFMGCGSGEIEVGMSAAAAANGARMNLQATVEQVFSEEFFQQSLLEELLQLPPTRPSSSSSSLLSFSVGSPADGSTSLLHTMTMSSATPSPRELTVAPLLHPRPPHPVPFGLHGHGHVHFPSAEADDAAMAQAMLAVISAASSSTLPTPYTPPPDNHRAQRWPRGGSTTAFRAYNAALVPRAPRRPPDARGQRMIKMGISILSRMHMIRCNRERTAVAAAQPQRGQEEEEAATAPSPPSSSQLHHMISERRRRERLNESFKALRGLLPPGSKKDKATVLANTLDYMNFLIAQISDLEAKNRSLEAQIHQRVHGSSTRTANEAQWLISGSPERVQVQVSSCADASTSSEPRREVTIRVVAPAECDLSELVVRVIALLKEMGRFTLVSVDARPPSSTSGIAQASLTLRATARAGAGGFDEASLKEAVTKAVEGLVTPPPDEP